MKRLAELKDLILQTRLSDLPIRVKRARERVLRREVDFIVANMDTADQNPEMCTRCQEEPLVPGSRFCYPCIVHYLDALPNWVRTGFITQEYADHHMAELMKTLLDNNLIGIPDDKDAPDEG